MVNQLIIIGNGFDLHCKLNTRFTDYFENNKLDENDEIALNFINFGANYNCNTMLNSSYLKKFFGGIYIFLNY